MEFTFPSLMYSLELSRIPSNLDLEKETSELQNIYIWKDILKSLIDNLIRKEKFIDN